MPTHYHLVLDWEEGEIIGLALPVDANPGGASIEDFQRRIPLIGLKNGVNVVFTTPDKFRRDIFLEVVSRNGVSQDEGATEDYTVSESGGVGTGYDTITFAIAPFVWEKIVIDYLKKP